MNFLELVFKQMRQRSLSTWLTLLSVMLGVALAVAILLFLREAPKVLAQGDFGYDLVIGHKGSGLQLVLNTVYHRDVSLGNLPWSVFEELVRDRPLVDWALPYAVGDTYKGYRIVGTLPTVLPIDHEGRPLTEMLDPLGRPMRTADGRPIPARAFAYRFGRTLELAEGRAFHPRKFEAVIGSDVARQAGLKLGSTFIAEHGTGDEKGHEHEETWTVVGILKPTRTAIDRVLYIPILTFWAIPTHEEHLQEAAKLLSPTEPHEEQHEHDHAHWPATTQAHEHVHDEHCQRAYHRNADGTIDLRATPDKWQVSAVLVRSRGAWHMATLMYRINNMPVAMAVNPAGVMRDFFSTFLKPSSQLLLVVSVLVSLVAAVSILVSIYNSVTARRREIAIIRALGATRQRVLALICVEAALVGLIGGLAGMVLGHLVAGGASAYLQWLLGQGMRWFATGWMEWLYLAGVVALSALAGLVPALKAYQTPVATNLAAT